VSRTILPERNLDFLRAFAVVLVFTSHLTDNIGLASPFTRWLGQAGVLAFFVHTSLVLMSSLERDGAPHQTHWISRFYIRRAFRIYPLAWVVIAVMIALKVPAGSLSIRYLPMTLPRVLANLGLVQNLAGESNILGPMWTLPLELQMYVLLPFCYLVARKGSLVRMIALILAGVTAAWFFIWGNLDPHMIPELWRFSVLEFIPCFLMGVFAFWALRRTHFAGRRALPSWSWPSIIFANVVLVFSFLETPDNWITRTVFCAVLGAAIPLLRDAADSRFSRLTHTIATYSYGIYLIHLLAIRVGFGVLARRPMPLQLAAVVAVLYVACMAAYHLIEKPGILLGQRLLRERQHPPPLEATAPAP
jgi:peptidoglycan/LPS O-acetylase OafA/YrhL